MNWAKWLLAVSLLIWSLSGHYSHAASVHELTCAEAWNNFPNDSKTMWVYGYITAVTNLKVLGSMANEKEMTQLFADLLWPEGHRIGSVVLELDAFCQNHKNRNMSLSSSMLHIVESKRQKGEIR